MKAYPFDSPPPYPFGIDYWDEEHEVWEEHSCYDNLQECSEEYNLIVAGCPPELRNGLRLSIM